MERVGCFTPDLTLPGSPTQDSLSISCHWRGWETFRGGCHSLAQALLAAKPSHQLLYFLFKVLFVRLFALLGVEGLALARQALYL